MQKTEINGIELMLPECHDGDKLWLASVLYSIETKNNEAGAHINNVVRGAMIQSYESTYLREIKKNSGKIEAESIARRTANIELRGKIFNHAKMNTGKFTKNY